VVLKWGLVPSWAKDPTIGNRLINARAETAAQKPSFRAAFQRRRCVILADGFYEWRTMRDGKVPYFITSMQRGPLAMAGLWERWQGAGGEEIETCTILTTAANRLLTSLHGRMPIILAPAACRRWLGPDADVPDAAHLLLGATENERLEYWPVSRAVNNPRNDGPELIDPAATES
jgi:putative SOS response-associated peptidase YedK